jgi:hypothetical protein
VCAPVCGLGNRLYALYTSYWAAHHFGVPLKIWWTPSTDTNCSYEDLFITKLEKFDGLLVDVSLYHYDKERQIKVQDSYLIKNNHRITDFDLLYDILILGANQPIRVSNHGDDDNATHIKFSFNRLEIQPQILNEISKFELQNAVGIHVGRGHILKKALRGSEKDIERLIPLEKYFQEIDTLQSDKPLFISCESEQDEKAFKDRYKERIIYKPGIKSRFTKEGIKEAFINILLLSKCESILDGHSSFSKIASYIGDISIKMLKNDEKILPTTT